VLTSLIHSVKVLNLTVQKLVISETFFLANLLPLVLTKLNPAQQKQATQKQNDLS